MLAGHSATRRLRSRGPSNTRRRQGEPDGATNPCFGRAPWGVHRLWRDELRRRRHRIGAGLRSHPASRRRHLIPGLVVVVVGRAELFTDNNLIATARADGKVTTRSLLRNRVLAYASNFIGAAASAGAMLLLGIMDIGGGDIVATAAATREAFRSTTPAATRPTPGIAPGAKAPECRRSRRESPRGIRCRGGRRRRPPSG